MPAEQDTAREAGVMRDAVDFRRFPWIRPLVRAYANDYASVAPLFAGDPADPAAWRQTIARVQRAPRDRATITHALARQLERRGAAPEARAAALSLADAATVAVVTGQQAGAFGGPLYTLLKAVTAIRLARYIREEHGVRAVPVFWVDAEDHDWHEVQTATVLDRDANVHHITLAPPEGAGSQPVGSLVLDARVDESLKTLEASLAPTEFTADVLAMLRRRYQPGATMSSAFAGWVEDLLGPSGLVVFEANDEAAKPAAAAIFGNELVNASRTVALVRDAAATMTGLGHAPQIVPAEDGVCLFYMNKDGRQPIKRQGESFLIHGQPRTSADLRDEALAHPERFSPNVMLRPLVQDQLFPTVCYVAGPAELAYQAQLGGVYQAFGVEAPLLYSRASATVLDSAAMRFLERYDVPIETLHAQDESQLNRLLERQLPVSIDRALEETAEYVAAQTERLKEAVAPIDPTLTGAVDTTSERIRETLKNLQAKIVQASKRKDDTLRRQFIRTRGLAFPDGHQQERLLSVAFFANRYGPAVGKQLLEALPQATDRHYLLTL